MQTPLQHSSSGAFLSAVFHNRQSKNSSYSLRAFARSLGVAPSYLLCLLDGTRVLSLNRAQVISERLNLSASDTFYLTSLVGLERARSDSEREPLRCRLRAFKQKQTRSRIGKKSFSILSRWYFPAIIAAIDTNDGPATVEGVASKLNLDVEQVVYAIKALSQNGWVKQNSDGSWSREIEHVLLKSETSDEMLRAYHVEMLKLTEKNLTIQPPGRRVTRTETLAINPEQIPKIKEMVEEFIEQLIAMAQEGDKRSEVFHLGLNFFKLENTKEKA